MIVRRLVSRLPLDIVLQIIDAASVSIYGAEAEVEPILEFHGNSADPDTIRVERRPLEDAAHGDALRIKASRVPATAALGEPQLYQRTFRFAEN
jgi:hypothetical protein